MSLFDFFSEEKVDSYENFIKLKRLEYEVNVLKDDFILIKNVEKVVDNYDINLEEFLIKMDTAQQKITYLLNKIIAWYPYHDKKKEALMKKGRQSQLDSYEKARTVILDHIKLRKDMEKL